MTNRKQSICLSFIVHHSCTQPLTVGLLRGFAAKLIMGNMLERIFTRGALLTLLVVLLPAASAATPAPKGRARVTTSFDAGWRFLKSDAAGAEKPDFDDAAWRALDVPHDWSIEGPFSKENPTGKDGGFLP